MKYARFTEMWHRDTKGANAVGKMVTDLLDAGLPPTFQFVKKKHGFCKAQSNEVCLYSGPSVTEGIGSMTPEGTKI